MEKLAACGLDRCADCQVKNYPDGQAQKDAASRVKCSLVVIISDPSSMIQMMELSEPSTSLKTPSCKSIDLLESMQLDSAD